MTDRIGPARHRCAVTVLGGPTTVAGPLTLTSERAAAAVLDAPIVIPAHYDGWAHFSEGRAEIDRAFDDAGLTSRLRVADHGEWTALTS